MPRKQIFKKIKRIVVKVGSSSLSENGRISSSKISKLVKDICLLKKNGYEVLLVTSGAITSGAGELGKKRDSLSLPHKQALASVGQTVLMNEYRKQFSKFGYHIGQILLTGEDVKNRHRFLNARNTLNALLELDVVPVINENDSVSVQEIKFGDNDTLSANIAGMIDSDLLIILSDVDGFYKNLSDSAPVSLINRITPEIISEAGGTGTIHGTGGMITKIRAAEMIIRLGEMMVIANSKTEKILQRVVSGEDVGTLFMGKKGSVPGKKRWLAIKNPRGKVIIDSGAVDALVNRKKSLLATGIKATAGLFEMGDVVELLSEDLSHIGKGIINYDSSDIDLIKGKKSDQIKKIIGDRYYDEVIHRDDMVVFQTQ